jgi:hypothetical protein
MTMITTVKSDLARRDSKDSTTERCPSHYRIRHEGYGTEVGMVLVCSRPKSRHRVHEALGYIQWERGDK